MPIADTIAQYNESDEQAARDAVYRLGVKTRDIHRTMVFPRYVIVVVAYNENFDTRITYHSDEETLWYETRSGLGGSGVGSQIKSIRDLSMANLIGCVHKKENA